MEYFKNLIHLELLFHLFHAYSLLLRYMKNFIFYEALFEIKLIEIKLIYHDIDQIEC